MKKFVFALAVLLLASQAWALDITCTVDGCDVTLSFSGASAGPVRGMAFDISLSDGNLADVQCLSAAYGYQIYPGSISIDGSGNVSDWGSCQCDGSYPGTLDASNAMTIEMGSLYEDGVDPDPCDDGDLVSFRVADNTAVCEVSVVVNEIRGGCVDEDATATDPVNLPAAADCNVQPSIVECMKDTHPDYAEWAGVNKPDCWCYARQCKGDADGLQQFGLFWVYSNDLTILKNAFAQSGVSDPPGICADFAHDEQFGLFRVYSNDLAILKTNFAQSGLTECDMTHFNFWVTP